MRAKMLLGRDDKLCSQVYEESDERMNLPEVTEDEVSFQKLNFRKFKNH